MPITLLPPALPYATTNTVCYKWVYGHAIVGLNTWKSWEKDNGIVFVGNLATYKQKVIKNDYGLKYKTEIKPI